MRKQNLSIIYLTGFALICSVTRVMADPAEDSDRRFLNNLENGKAQQAAASATAPISTKTEPSNSAASEKAAAEKSSYSEKTAKRTHKQRPAPVAQATHGPTVAFGGQPDPAAAPVPPGTMTERRMTIVQTPDVNDDHDRDQDEHHHHFFHNFFNHLFNNQHPEDW